MGAGNAGAILAPEGAGTMPVTTNKSNAALWVIQGLLAALFLFAGGFKLALPLAALAKVSPLPAAFLKFIGVCEVTGAVALILPGLLRIRTGLTPLAAAGLVIIMIGATVVTVATQGAAPAVLAFDGLHPPATGARVRFAGGKATVTDGPFTEAKEVLGGYWMIQVKSRAEAIEWAKRAPMQDGDIIEVRQVQEISDFPPDVQKAAGR